MTDRQELMGGQEETVLGSEDEVSVGIRDVMFTIMQQLGHLSVPQAVLNYAKRREEAFDSVSTIVQLDPALADGDDGSDGEDEESEEDRIEHFLSCMEDPSLKIRMEPAFLEEMSKPPKVERAAVKNPRNFWSAVRELEPYEHSAFKKLEISIQTEPYTAASDLYFVATFRPSAFGSTKGLSMLGALKSIAMRDCPADGTRRPKSYSLDAQENRWGEGSNETGVGVLWESDDESETATTEMRGLKIIFHQRFKGTTPKEDAAGKLQQTEEVRELAYDRLTAHSEIVMKRLPLLLENFNQLWNERLPSMDFCLQANRREGEGDLQELKEASRRQAYKEIPPEITDERQKNLYLDTVQPKPEVSFKMVGGLEYEKRQISRMVNRAKHPERYADAGIVPKATVLLVGPPGCGKTMLAEAAANAMDGIYLKVKVSDIESMWAGEAEKNIAALFDLIKNLSEEHKVTMFVDEFEGLASSRNSQHMMNWERKITTEFLSALNDQFPNCLIIAATNDGGHVDAAVTRSGRFNLVLSIPKPEKDERASIITNWIDYFDRRSSLALFDGVDIDLLAGISSGLTGADLETIIENCIGDAVDDSVDEEEPLQMVTTAALAEAIQRMKHTNTERQSSYLDAN